jgi:hypothetical protein
MTGSDVQPIAPAAAAAQVEPEERVYAMSREGRRQALILLLGVASIWIFALWTLITILQDGVGGVEWVSLILMLGMLVVAPVVAWTLLEEAYSRVVTDRQGIKYHTIAGIGLSYAWDDFTGFKPKGGRGRLARFFLGEDGDTGANDNIGRKVEAGEPRPGGDPTRDDGDTKMEARVSEGAAEPGLEPATAEQPPPPTGDEEEDGDPETLLLQVRNDRTGQIANPVTRFLHRQAHGTALPVYGGLENRSELLDEIASHLPAATNP